MKVPKIAFIGAGNIARAHRNSFTLAEAALVGVCDPSAAAREVFCQAEYANLPQFASAEEMLAQTTPDAVVISTPPSQREAELEAALAHDCGVLMEKPLAQNLESARRMAERVEGRPGVYAVGFCHRFVPAVEMFRQWVSEQKYGRLISVQNTFGGHAPGQKDHWMSDPAVSGGGVMMDVACHSLDLVQYIGGTFAEISGSLRNSWAGRGEDSFGLAGRTEDDAIVQILGSWVFPASEFSLRLRFEQADVRFEYGESFQLRTPGNPWEEITLEDDANIRFRRQAEGFLAALTGEQTVHATFQEAVEISTILAKLYAKKSPSVPHCAVA